MRHVRPFDPNSLAPATASWLVAPDEAAGVIVALHRGGGEYSSEMRDTERFALVLSGAAQLHSARGRNQAGIGNVVFIPARTAGAIAGGTDATWLEIEAPTAQPLAAEPQLLAIDPSKFEGEGFAYQSLIDRSKGASSLRMNVVQVQPGSGSPDYHIHAFAQIYLIIAGEMTIDIGRKRLSAKANSLVFLPAGLVHRNFNASQQIERHVTLLVPEPREDQVFDFAVTIHDHEAELLKTLPL